MPLKDWIPLHTISHVIFHITLDHGHTHWRETSRMIDDICRSYSGPRLVMNVLYWYYTSGRNDLITAVGFDVDVDVYIGSSIRVTFG